MIALAVLAAWLGGNLIARVAMFLMLVPTGAGFVLDAVNDEQPSLIADVFWLALWCASAWVLSGIPAYIRRGF